MKILWDEEKNYKLRSERGVGFEDAAFRILNGDIIDIMKNPTREGQYYFIINLNQYIHVVPFIIGEDEIILKTIYPSRKYQKSMGE
ncbi:BrnT family toxin [Candidatus Magnetomoraceae bacterium gMMP-1]